MREFIQWSLNRRHPLRSALWLGEWPSRASSCTSTAEDLRYWHVICSVQRRSDS